MDAATLIGHIFDQGRIIYGKHFRDELAADHLDIADAFHVLQHGRIYSEPEQDIKTGEWKYRIEGVTSSAKRIAIIFCFKSEQDAFLITVFGLTR